MGHEPRNPDYETAVRQSFGRQSAMETLGANLVLVEPGRTVIEFARSERFLQQHGYMHAGAATTIVDSACGYAALSLMKPDAEVVTVEFKVNFIRPSTGQSFRAEGRVVSSGRQLTVCEGEVTDMATGRTIVRMQATMMTIEPAES
jgi:uncharacterized protein (TIGR00369 family)